jgi:hypothetical protein
MMSIRWIDEAGETGRLNQEEATDRPGASGHRFGPDLQCSECGIGWDEHQRNPHPCKTETDAEAFNRRPSDVAIGKKAAEALTSIATSESTAACDSTSDSTSRSNSDSSSASASERGAKPAPRESAASVRAAESARKS